MTQYIDKSALIAEIDRLQKLTMDINHNFTSDYNQGLYDGLSQLELFIDSLPKEKKTIREYVSPEDSTLGKLLKEMKDFSPQEDLGLSNEEYNDVVNELIFGKEKSVNEDLEEAAKIYTISLVVNEIVPDATVKQLREVADKSFKAGAQWGKKQTEIQIKTQSMALPHGCLKKEPVNNDLEEAASQYPSVICQISPQWKSEVENVFKAGAEWQKEQMMKEAVGAEAIYLNQLGWSITTDIPIEHLVKNGDKVKVLIIKEE